MRVAQILQVLRRARDQLERSRPLEPGYAAGLQHRRACAEMAGMVAWLELYFSDVKEGIESFDRMITEDANGPSR